MKFQAIEFPFQEAIEEVAAKFSNWHEYDVVKIERVNGVEFNYVDLLDEDNNVVRSIRIIINGNDVEIEGI